MRTKVTLECIVPRTWGGVQTIFRCLYDNSIPEDRRFQKATPSGTINLDIDNPAVVNQLVVGKSYYVDLTEVPDL